MTTSQKMYRLVMKIDQDQEDRIALLMKLTGLKRTAVVNLAITETAARKQREVSKEG